MEIHLPQVLLVIFIMTAGTTLQSTVGFGMGLSTGPFLVLINRAYVPGPMLFTALILTFTMAWRERHAIDLSGIKYSVLGRLLSTPLAAIAVGMLTEASYDLVFGCFILVAVAMSLAHGGVKPTGRNVFLAGIASGIMSTICAIGGPPMALVYQNERGPRLRSTLAALFFTGCLISLTALAIVGRFVPADLVRSGIMLIGVIIGLKISKPLINILDKYSIRPYILGVCTVAALIVLLRALLIIR